MEYDIVSHSFIQKGLHHVIKNVKYPKLIESNTAKMFEAEATDVADHCDPSDLCLHLPGHQLQQDIRRSEELLHWDCVRIPLTQSEYIEPPPITVSPLTHCVQSLIPDTLPGQDIRRSEELLH